MSMYNMLFGQNPFSDLLLALVGLKRDDVPRFRDVFIDEQGRICVYTRTGGGNRDAYASENAALADNPNYASDYDDDFDSTYAYFVFNVPEEQRHVVEALQATMDEKRSPTERFADLLRLMQSDPEHPDVKAAVEKMRPVLERIVEALGQQSEKDEEEK